MMRGTGNASSENTEKQLKSNRWNVDTNISLRIKYIISYTWPCGILFGIFFAYLTEWGQPKIEARKGSKK